MRLHRPGATHIRTALVPDGAMILIWRTQKERGEGKDRREERK
jgi:hypothetical protein